MCVTPSSVRLFKREAVETGQLTVEHAPPKRAGGNALALTCATCNHSAGSQLDAHAHVAERMSGGDDGLIVERPVKLTLGHKRVNATFSFGPKGVQIFGAPKHNSPKGHEEFFAEFATYVGPSPDFRLVVEFHRDRFDPARAAVSWLRAAYIVTFAKFGYRFILDTAFRDVRQKIQQPKSQLLPLFSITVPGPSTERAFVVVREPSGLRGSIAVRMGRHLVLLPRPGDTAFYERIAGNRGAAVTVAGTEYNWPTRPEFLFDFVSDGGDARRNTSKLF